MNENVNVNEILEQSLRQMVEDIRENLAVTGTNTKRMTTSNSLEVRMFEDGGQILGRKAFDTVEKGSKPGPRGAWFNKIIRQWMEDKGITASPMPYKRKPSERWQPKYDPAERGATAMANAIAWKIRKEGTRLFRDGGRDDIYTSVFNKRIPELMEKLTISVTKRI